MRRPVGPFREQAGTHCTPRACAVSLATGRVVHKPQKPLFANFSDRGPLFQRDRGRRFRAMVDAQGMRASEVLD